MISPKPVPIQSESSGGDKPSGDSLLHSYKSSIDNHSAVIYCVTAQQNLQVQSEDVVLCLLQNPLSKHHSLYAHSNTRCVANPFPRHFTKTFRKHRNHFGFGIDLHIPLFTISHKGIHNHTTDKGLPAIPDQKRAARLQDPSYLPQYILRCRVMVKRIVAIHNIK